MDSVQKASDRYKIATIDMAFPEIHHVEQKKASLQDRLSTLSPGLFSNEL